MYNILSCVNRVQHLRVLALSLTSSTCDTVVLDCQVIDVDLFEVVIVSPRNHFLFTPMLPSTAVGTVEFRWAADDCRTGRIGWPQIQQAMCMLQ